MKIRKTTLEGGQSTETVTVYIYENKKEEYSVVSVPLIEWSILITYEEDFQSVRDRVRHSLGKILEEQNAENLTESVYQWICEM